MQKHTTTKRVFCHIAVASQSALHGVACPEGAKLDRGSNGEVYVLFLHPGRYHLRQESKQLYVKNAIYYEAVIMRPERTLEGRASADPALG